MACSPRTGRLGNIAFKKETTWGTYIAGDLYLRASSESLNRIIDHTEDDALVGEIYTTDLIITKDGASGSIEGNAYPDTVGVLMQGVLGNEIAVSDPYNALIVVTYNGSAAYARLSLVGTDLLAEDSSDGSSWAADTNFGTGGTLDISGATADTFTELTALIDSYTGYQAKLFGDGTEASSNIPAFAVTNIFEADKNAGGILLRSNISGSTVAKTHALNPSGATTCLPSYSFTINRVLGTDKSVAFTGSKFSGITISTAAKDLVKVSLPIIAKAELTDQTDISLTLPEVQAFTAPKMEMLIVQEDGTQITFNEVKEHSITINTNIDENMVIGSLNILEQIRQNATIEFSFSANNTSDQYAVRPEYINDRPVEMYLYYESNTDVDTANSIPYSMLIRVNNAKIKDFNSPLSTPDRLTITGSGQAIKATGTNTNHIDVFVVDGDITTY